MSKIIFKNLKLLSLLLIFLILPWLNNFNESQLPIIDIEKNTVGYYQANTCQFNLIQVLKSNYKDIKFHIYPDKSSSVECHGKVNGVDIVNGEIKVYIGTNILIDLIVQSLFWMFCISLISKDKNYVKFKFKHLYIVFLLIFTLYSISSENSYYKLFVKDFDLSIRNTNYFLLTLIVFLYLIFDVLIEIIEKRSKNLINYFPFLFLIIGAFNSLNLNFFIFVLCIYGLKSVLEKSFHKLASVMYLIVSIFVIVQYTNNKQNVLFFDIDKLKGFSNSSNNYNSVIFWIVAYYLIILGTTQLIKISKTNLDFQLLKKNFLVSGALLTILGLLSSISPYLNFFTYYFLGLNKSGIKNLVSVDGNTWRGLASSAESLGEFYGYTFLLILLLMLIKKIKINTIDYFLIFISFYGMYRANNASAGISFLILVILFIIQNKISFTKKIKQLFLLISFIFLITLILISNTYSSNYLSTSLIKYGLENSQIYYDFQEDQNNNTAIDNLNFAEILKVSRKEINLSTSLYYVMKSYNDERNIKNIPSFITVAGAVAVTINRSEKWGIFLAKYNPTFEEFLFGYGPNQLVNYYKNFDTKVNEGLVLPHSSFLDLLIFFGFFGLVFFIIYYGYILKQNYKNKIFLYVSAFMILNLLKSDSILYLNSFVLTIFTLNLYRFPTEKNEQ